MAFNWLSSPTWIAKSVSKYTALPVVAFTPNRAESDRGDNTLLLDSAVVTDLPAGTYFVLIRTGTFRAQRKLVILH